MTRAITGGPEGFPSVEPEAQLFNPEEYHLQERETAFLDAFQALMYLWSDESKREVAEKIFGLVRAIRILDVEETGLSFADGMPPPFNPKPVDAGERPSRILRELLDHHLNMKEFMRTRQEGINEQVQRSDALLREALATAKSLVGKQLEDNNR